MGLKKSAIEIKIKNKIDAWVKTLPENLQNETRYGIIVTGGCITSMLLGEEVNDYDVYFSNIEIAKKVARHYIDNLVAKDVLKSVDKFAIGLYEYPNNEGLAVCTVSSKDYTGNNEKFLNNISYEDYIKGRRVDEFFNNFYRKLPDADAGKYKARFLTSNAITLTDQIQLIIRFVGGAEQIHKNFDFAHCKNYWTYTGGLVVKEDALMSILAKELKYSGSKYPICSLFRIRKFIKRGWNITAGQILKMCYEVNELNLKDKDVLYDQLTGVDAAYFGMFIRKMTEAENNGIEITKDYFIELIDKVFDMEYDYAGSEPEIEVEYTDD